ncbi:MAG: flagellar basal body-associated FliL family protein [Armatimonadota bacterium]
MIGHGPRSGKKLASVAVIIAVIVAAGAGGMVLRPKLAPKASAEESKEKNDKKAASKAHGKPDPKPNKHEAESEKEEVEASDIVELGEFLVNLGGGSGTRYLRAEVSMRLSGLEAGESKHGKPAAPTLPAGDAAIARDRIVTVLSSGVFEQLRDNAGREKLKERMLERLHQALPAYEIHEVLFTAFVMQ